MALSTLLKSIVRGVNVFIAEQYGAVWYLDGNYWEVVVLENLRCNSTRDDVYNKLGL